jgi:hypothetical protein
MSESGNWKIESRKWKIENRDPVATDRRGVFSEFPVSIFDFPVSIFRCRDRQSATKSVSELGTSYPKIGHFSRKPRPALTATH